MKQLFLFFIFLSVMALSMAQDNHPVNTSSTDVLNMLRKPAENGAVVRVIQDEKLNNQLYRHLDFCRKNNSLNGFRIRIFSNSGQTARQKALNEKGRFMKLFPSIESYMIYDTPNFKVYVGDFRTKSDALYYLKQISVEFHNAFVVPDRINYPTY